jgi:hypothetical protein
MAISRPVHRYYAEHIFAQTTRAQAPPNFRPLDRPHTGMSSVEGCRGGGKNITEVFLIAAGGRIEDVRVSCGLCNPAMYVATDILATWARSRTLDEVLALDPHRIEDLAPFFEHLGGPGRPDDAREKFQYALVAVQNAVRDHLGQDAVATPAFEDPEDRDLDEDRDPDDE